MGRIDIHHHALSAEAIELMRDLGLPTPGQRWQLDRTLDMMDANNIEASVVSNVVPCDVLDDAAMASRLARQMNEAAAEVVRRNPNRFGFFAILPLPHVDLALEEAAYAFDELGADAVALLPHGGDHYLGAPLFDPIFAELNRRRAVVLVHPMDLPEGRAPDVPSVFADYLLDTTRAAINLITSGTLARYRELSVILSHAGGFLPYAASRIEVAAELLANVDPHTVRDSIRRFYYDLALSVPAALPSLLAAADSSHILYGTDWSGVPASVVEQATRVFDEHRLIDDRTGQAINRGNALELLPGLAARLNATPSPAALR
jgi:predicted TIM-barrel fold metal-dependent hydrolase